MSKAGRQAQVRQEQARQERDRAAALDRTLDWQSRGRARAVRTAWIVAGLALAFFVAALVEGHFGHLHPSWEPQHSPASAAAAGPVATPAPDQAAAGHASAVAHNTPSPRP